MHSGVAEEIRRDTSLPVAGTQSAAPKDQEVSPSPEVLAAVERVRVAELTRLLYGAHLTIVGGGNKEEIYPDGDRFFVAVNSSFMRFLMAPDFLVTGPGYTGMIREPEHAHIRLVREYERESGREFHRRIDVPILSETFVRCSPFGPGDEWYNAFSKKLKTRPLTGIAALAFFLRFPIQSIHLTGFDFYTNTYRFIPFEIGGHRLFSQVDWLRETIETDARVTADENSLDVLCDDYPREACVRAMTSTGYEMIRRLGYSDAITNKGDERC